MQLALKKKKSSSVQYVHGSKHAAFVFCKGLQIVSSFTESTLEDALVHSLSVLLYIDRTKICDERKWHEGSKSMQKQSLMEMVQFSQTYSSYLSNLSSPSSDEPGVIR